MKKIILPAMLISLVLLVACTPSATTTKGAFIGGTAGITASFEPLSIKEGDIYTIFDTEEFTLDILLKNRGEENLPVGKAILRLLGPAQENFQGIPQWKQLNQKEIEKISEFNPEGGEEIVPFAPQGKAKYLAEVIGFTDVTWNLEYSYDYKTHLIINDICFKGDITDPRVCEVKEAKAFSVSGAPITVISVEEDNAGKGVILLKINVKNAGTGDATVVGQEFDNRFDQVAYTVEEPEKWECKSGGRDNEARLIDGSAQIICRLKNALREDDLYVKNIRLTFGYTYKDLVQETLRIKESVR